MADDPRRALPKVDELARSAAGLAPADVLQEAARQVIAGARAVLGPGAAPPSLDSLRAALVDDLTARGPLCEVVNATGVLLHTNLGRAPVAGGGLAPEIAVDLELDRVTGARGRRFAGLERSLAILTGAEAALVVNNNAAAVLLAVSALAAGREVIVARGELVEIGGTFRIPEVIVQGGAVLREVGATNCLHPRDLEDVMHADTGLALEVHPSNYRLVGFTTTVATRERAEIAHRHGVPLVVDAGAGLLDERCPWLAGGAPAWVTGEPGVRQLLGAGADVVAFSGDKLLGGPQAGILVGPDALVDRIRHHPLARAVRFDKVRAAHLEATLLAYHEGTVASDIPFWNLATAPIQELERRALQLRSAIADLATADVVPAVAVAGAGCLAEEPIPDMAVAIHVPAAEAVARRLRCGDPAVLATIHDGAVRLSMRSVRRADDGRLAAAVRSALECR